VHEHIRKGWILCSLASRGPWIPFWEFNIPLS